MINFRFHLVSLVAVFLALGIGVIVGSAVIDSAVVDQLRSQQNRLEARISSVESENGQLRSALKARTDIDSALAREGRDQLLVGELTNVPVLVVATEGTGKGPIEDLVAQLSTAGAGYRGTVWLTDRFALDDDAEIKDLATVLGTPEAVDPIALRAAAVGAVADALRPRSPDAADDVASGPTLLAALLDRGFIDVTAPAGQDDKLVPSTPLGTRLVVVSSPQSTVVDDLLALPLARGLVADRAGRLGAWVVAAVIPGEATPGDAAPLDMVTALRADDLAARRVSTVDDLSELAGRLAVVLAVSDLPGHVGHYGHGRGAQRLLPARVAAP